ncbi:hypothetical protein HYQ19_gp083 [Arthrobacter phage DrYang]|uniref:Uncharacterized protein n=1 Tax=Arthrobacter phage DrYang TaxID=2686080 RepID=A0A6B9JEA6_9CAUD|nr:hypothetical protein HYQ19_gp083 [Arthrobacter phage DrYang]QGZ17182.1 hypothetical protein SEA_DRYANG_83 [Arthrobacter phage DrYang]
MATEVYTPEIVWGHSMNPDIQIDRDGKTWLFIETQYGKYKADHATVTAPPFSDFADPITRTMGFDPGKIDTSRVSWGAHIARDGLGVPFQAGPLRFDVL